MVPDDLVTGPATTKVYAVRWADGLHGPLNELAPTARLQLETHLENVAVLAEQRPVHQLKQVLPCEGDAFVFDVEGQRAYYEVNEVAGSVDISRLEPLAAPTAPGCVENE